MSEIKKCWLFLVMSKPQCGVMEHNPIRAGLEELLPWAKRLPNMFRAQSSGKLQRKEEAFTTLRQNRSWV